MENERLAKTLAKAQSEIMDAHVVDASHEAANLAALVVSMLATDAAEQASRAADQASKVSAKRAAHVAKTEAHAESIAMARERTLSIGAAKVAHAAKESDMARLA